MKETPILFSTTMVKAILEGRKTMTRRVIDLPEEPIKIGWGWTTVIDKYGYEQPGKECFAAWGENWHVKIRYATGDLLWVRETWSDFYGDIIYKADEDRVTEKFRWNPSLFMPKTAARIWLEITGVKIERLQAITEKDAAEEGVEAIDPLDMKKVPLSVLDSGGGKVRKKSYRAAFYLLWEELNAKRGYGWDVNPWVYAITFKRVEKNDY
jgi:hypothetical protein